MAVIVNEEKLRKLLEEFYEMAWDHGFESQSPLRPEIIFDRFIERCKEKD